ncbi:MAG: 16S rRNA (cytidine(1402)-2'-O)-methyltransferase [Gammaproteobacteria bacterium]
MATPIGNLGDIGLRALETLRNVEAVAAEDTRVTRRLLARHGIAKRLIPVHEHNERRAAAGVLALLRAGRSVALTCDAGTPAISDPGAALVAAARAAGFPVTPVPGPSAAIAALSVSGLAAPHHLFYGFLPARAAARRKELSALALLPFTLVFFEAPHRVEECVSDLCAVLGGARRIVIARELTKLFESVHACTLAEAGAWLAGDPDRRRGEFVLIVEGAAEKPAAEGAGEQVLTALLAELPLRKAVDLAARITGRGKNPLYKLALQLRKRES